LPPSFAPTFPRQTEEPGESSHSHLALGSRSPRPRCGGHGPLHRSIKCPLRDAWGSLERERLPERKPLQGRGLFVLRTPGWTIREPIMSCLGERPSPRMPDSRPGTRLLARHCGEAYLDAYNGGWAKCWSGKHKRQAKCKAEGCRRYGHRVMKHAAWAKLILEEMR